MTSAGADAACACTLHMYKIFDNTLENYVRGYMMGILISLKVHAHAHALPVQYMQQEHAFALIIDLC